jgi:N-acetylglucosamine-6-phosphate deacetylase
MTRLALRGGCIPAEFAPAAAPATLAARFTGCRVADLLVESGRIIGVDSTTEASQTLDAGGCLILPGFVDLHIHGSAGADVMDATPAALETIARFLASRGVTSFLATTMTAPHAATLAAVAAVRAHGSDVPGGARILGVHLEGPYLSPKFPGAQQASLIRPPNLGEFEALVTAGPVRMITLAPEVAGAHDLIRAAQARDITVVLGHTDATYAACQTAIELGVSQATHTYNAMRGLHHREPGTLGAVLSDDRLFAQLIADNVHVHPAAMRILARCKGVERTVLITDAIRATGLPPGEYELGGQPVTVQHGECRLADGTLAGSILTLDRALVNFLAASGLAVAQAWAATSRTPARSIGMDGEIGSLAPGARADLVILDEALTVVATVVGGEVVYLREGERLRKSIISTLGPHAFY